MLEMFEKLINEHGSSVILKERLELFSDKYSLLEEKAIRMEQRNQALETELQQAYEKIRELETTLDSFVDKQGQEGLHVDAQSILKLLFDAEGLAPEAIAHQMSMDVGIVQYHLDELGKQEFARISSVTMGSPFTGSRGAVKWGITSEGRKIVVEVIGR